MSAAPLLWGLLAFLTPGACGQCHSPPRLHFAVPKHNSKSVFDIGYSLTYECRPGYVTKRFHIICLANSTWSSVNDDVCKRRSCGTPADLLNGQMEITGLEFGSTIKYSCSDGYRLVGHSVNQCILSGNTVIWDKKAPLCEPIRCGLPPAIPNGRYKTTMEYFSYGMVVSYECNTGPRGEKLYDLVGNKTLYCTSNNNKDGIWNSPPPRCITAAMCKTPVIANGRRVSGFRRVYSLNDAVELECNPGFTMKGSKIVRCQINSQWEPALPLCFRGCLPPAEISHGKSNRTKDHFSFGEAVSYVCEPGYSLIGTASIKCIAPGKWNYATPKCEVKSCGVFLDQLPNGRVISPHQPRLGTKVSFVCNEGFWLNGSSSSTCVAGAATVFWSNKMPVCQQIICGPPPPIINGRLPFLSQNKFPHGIAMSYTCSKMFRMIGAKTTRCTSGNQANGVWSVPAPRCEAYNKAALCSEPKVLGRHLKLKSRPPFRHGDILRFACDTNFTIKGSDILWCQADSTWGPSPLPMCESDCPSPSMIPNGQHKESYSGPVAPGLSVTYSCEPGYLLIGEKTIHCLSSGVWNATAPKCKEALCDPLIKFPNGQVEEPSHLRIGAVMTFSCNKGYHLQGQASSKCVLSTEGAVWTKIPTCVEVVCPPPPVIENGKYTGSSADAVPYGTKVTYECNADSERGVKFNLIGESTIHCKSDQEGKGIWSAAAPRCELSASSIQCLHPRVPNGYNIFGQGPPYFYNDIVVFRCDIGFTLKGSRQIRCSANATWDPEAPICEKACQPLPEIPHGQHTGSTVGLLEPGTSITYSCDLGYSLVGEETIHCTAEGVWKPLVPHCKAILCPPPPVIENGKYTGSSAEDVPYGTKVTYECNADPERGVKFNLIGESTIHCKSDQESKGIWSAAAPRCELSASSIQCLHPRVPNGYKISGQGPPYFYNDTVVFRCDIGFTLKGSRQIRCSANATWDPEAPICEKACQPLPEIPHGQHTGSTVGTLEPGTSVTYSCDLGYSLIGEETIRCTAEGVWKPLVPHCKAILCPPPPVIENGKYTGSSAEDVPYGTKVTYECNADPERGVKFNLIGESTIHCKSDQEGKGIWSAAAPQCELSASSIQCLHPRVPNGYKISGQGPPYFYNDTVVFRCDIGFTLKGSRQIRCSANATWDPEAPICEKACQPLPEIPHGQHTGSTVGLLEPGTSITYSCDLGYSLVGEETIHCTAEGVWKPLVPHCKAILCPPPPVIENGKYTGSSAEDVPHGTKVTYECNADPERGVKFNLIGESTIHCKSDQEGKGIWSAAAPRCELSASSIQCLHPRVPNGYKISGQGPPYFYNDTVVFRCDIGFTLKGSRQIRCNANATWDPEAPICEKACQPLPEIPHGQHTGSTVGLLEPGTSITYSCDLGYSLVGEETIHCTAEGVWKPLVPHCKAILCPPPPVIENGKYTGSSAEDVPYGTKVTYECNADPERGVKFNLIGESTIHCKSDQEGKGIWSAAAPRCELSASSIQCLHPRVPNGYKISGQGPPYFYNDTVVFRCDIGFTLKGSRQIRCNANATWDPEAPICEKACQPLPEIPHGQHTGSTVGLLEPGTSITYSCDLGYSLVGEETIHCTAEGVWKPLVPHCKAILCPPPPVIENGKYTGSSAEDVPYGTKVTYECNADPERGVKFNLIGESTIHCKSDQEGKGIWSAAAPRCELSASSIQCLHPRVPNGYKISEQGPPYFYNDTVVFHCDIGFTLKGSRQIRCSASGTWVPEMPVCEKEASCETIEEQLQLPSDGSPVVPVNSSCQEGFQLTGHVYKLCWNPEAGNRFWFQKIPLCKEVNCSLPEFIIGAQNVSTKKIYNFGAIFTLKCDKGYILEGSPQSQCQEDHGWDPPLAVCKSRSHGPLVLSGIVLGTLLLILFVGVTLAIISKHKEGNYYTNENCKEVAIHLETRESSNSDAYSSPT
ncbi:complement receptor type 2-like isoform X3 [Trichosurus vulpecula]|uniref:complement receptor type 2-like isoform X3 n=1 Tax=Trichosurus vulpecula TaxID=9337 RepID=UPI00186B4902|nr:complement receptor type 2-like isoform X3 [Trichosurus vulpecula]